MTQHLDESVLLPPPSRYVLDPDRCNVRFATRHLFGLAPVRGRFTIMAGALDVADPVTESLIQVEIDAASFTTGNSARDQTVRGRRYLDTTQYPTISFTEQSIERDGTDWSVVGTLTARGVQRPVRLAITRLTVATAPDGGHTLEADATTSLDRTEFGIVTARGMAGRYLTMQLHVYAASA